MHFSTFITISLCVLARGLVASSLFTRATDDGLIPNDYLELWREEATIPGDYLVYYGPPNNTVATRTTNPQPVRVEERSSCGTTAAPSCHTSNTARNAVCDSLVTELQGDYDVSVPQSPRQICYEGNSETNEYCCVSWHNVVPSLQKGDLAGYAYESKSLSLLIIFPAMPASPRA
jgi:hypothetical protein